jgi:uncharacterized protein (DUF433 family)
VYLPSRPCGAGVPPALWRTPAGLPNAPPPPNGIMAGSAVVTSQNCGIMSGVGRSEAVSDGWIVTDVEILGGKPCVKGTRLSVEFLLELDASGATQVEILARYPQLSAEGLFAAFHFAARPEAER